MASKPTRPPDRRRAARGFPQRAPQTAAPEGARNLRGEARPAAGAARGGAALRARGRGEAARARQVHGARAGREAARPGLLPGARHVRAPPHLRLRHAEEPALGRRRRDRPRHDRRAHGVRVQPGLHRLRRLAGRGDGREDVQDHGSGGQDRLPGDRHQRLRRRAHPGGRRLARRLRRRVRPQRQAARA